MLYAKSGQNVETSKNDCAWLTAHFLSVQLSDEAAGFDWNQSPDEDLANPLTIQAGRNAGAGEMRNQRQHGLPQSVQTLTKCLQIHLESLSHLSSGPPNQ